MQHNNKPVFYQERTRSKASNGIENNKTKIRTKKSFFSKIIKIILFLGVLFSALFYYIISPSSTTEDYKIINIEKGDGASTLALKLKKEKIIRSENIFKLLLKLSKADKNIHIGKYKIPSNKNNLQIVNLFRENKVIDESVKVTILEGEPNYKIAKKLKEKLGGNFSESIFMNKAHDREGFLFPDTYKIDPKWDEEKIINTFHDNYKNKIKKYLPFFKDDLSKIGKTEKEIVTMASIVEGEAGNVSQFDKRMVAGVLWKRIEIGMPLQADAVFSYIKQEHIGKVMFSDLEVESEYNIYKKRGLPPGPIGNPGIAAIRGALNPEETEYLFYLTDKNLKFHYAITYSRHLENQKKYITNAQ